MIMNTLSDGRDVIIAGSKGGVALALDLDKSGAVVWRTNIAERAPGAAGLPRAFISVKKRSSTL